MATQHTPLFEQSNGVDKSSMGFDWDDVSNQVTQFTFDISTGVRGATFTLTKTVAPNAGAVRTHDFVPGQSRIWAPPFIMPVAPTLNPKTNLIVGLPSGWMAELALV